MKSSSIKAICTALDAHKVRFMFAGGLAVIAHGYLRFTKDADIAIELAPENISQTFAALATLGYGPTVPVTSADLADAQTRERLIREKNMQVLQFVSDQHRDTPVDMFVFLPFNFADEFGVSIEKELRDVGHVHFVSYETLVNMKRTAGREQDIIDVRELESRRGVKDTK